MSVHITEDRGPKTEHRGQSTGHRAQGTGHEHRAQSTGHRTQCTVHRAQCIVHRAQNTEHSATTDPRHPSRGTLHRTAQHGTTQQQFDTRELLSLDGSLPPDSWLLSPAPKCGAHPFQERQELLGAVSIFAMLSMPTTQAPHRVSRKPPCRWFASSSSSREWHVPPPPCRRQPQQRHVPMS